MKFAAPLIRATLIKRYKRFLSDHLLADGTEVTAHVANTGAMLGLHEPGMETWLSPANDPKRKLKFTWELVRAAKGKNGLVGINTQHPNNLAAEAIADGTVSELAGYPTIRREVRYGSRKSRIDLLLEADDRPPCYVEVKNVHLRRSGPAEFPDSVTARGAKHLLELKDMVQEGARAVMLYTVQRADCDAFRLADDIDPDYAAAFADARAGGVEALCYSCKLDETGIWLDRALPINV